MARCCSDVCSAPLRFGDWHHKVGCGYDLCCQHRRELSEKDEEASDAQYIEVTSEAQISANSAEFSDYLRNAQLLYEAPSAEGMTMFGEDDGPPDAEGNDSDSDSDEDDNDGDDDDEGGGDEEGGGGPNAAQPPADFMGLEDFLEGGLQGLHGTHAATSFTPSLPFVRHSELSCWWCAGAVQIVVDVDGLHGGEELVEVTAPDGEGDGDILL